MYNGVLAIKKNEILPFATTWLDPEGIMLSEVNQTEKDKYCMISLMRGIYKNPKNQMNKQQNRNRAMGSENKQVVTRMEGVVRGGEIQVRGIKRYKLPFAK